MSQRTFMRECRACLRSTLHVQQTPTHILHLLLSIFTLGLWIPVWLLLGLFGSGVPQCTVCGREPGFLERH